MEWNDFFPSRILYFLKQNFFFTFIFSLSIILARVQYKVWWLVTSHYFEYLIFAMILLNTITLAMRVSCVSESVRVFVCNK